MKRAFLILLLGFFATMPSAWAGMDVKSELEKINKAYASGRNLSFDVTYRYFTDHTTSSSSEVIQGSVKKKGKAFRIRYDNIEHLSDGRTTILVDNDNKYVLLNNQREAPDPFNIGIDLDSLHRIYSSYKILRESSLTRTLRLELKEGYVEAIEIEYDKNTYWTQRMVLYFRSAPEGQSGQPRLEVNYSNLKLDPQFSKEDFNIGRYLLFNKEKGYVLTSRYAAYTLLNYNTSGK